MGEGLCLLLYWRMGTSQLVKHPRAMGQPEKGMPELRESRAERADPG